MDEPVPNRWIGKSAEEVLADSYHEIRDPIYNAVGFLNVLKSVQHLSLAAEQVQEYIDLALTYAVHAQDIVDSVMHYMNEQRKDP